MQLPATFGKYELLERIATGGMAEVYLARSFGVAGFEKRLVIKRIRPELARDPHHVSLFIHEAKIGVHLNHENVVQVYDLGRVGRDWFIAMEHLHGRDLNKLVKALRAEGERLPVEVAVHVVAEVCRGLAHAHGLVDAEGRPLGVVHRDVSPHNILLTFSGAVKLVDFGIARLVGTGSTNPEPEAQPAPSRPEPGDDATEPAVARRPGGGKYAYMSPEQARGDDVDHRTDVFSAGIVLWELLVGHRMYQHPDAAEKLRRVQMAEIPTFSDEGVDVEPALARALARALAARPEDRYPSAALFEEDLRAWLFEHGTGDARQQLADLLLRAFPEEARQRGRAPGLERMLADVDRLGGDPPEAGSTSTPSEPEPQARFAAAIGENKRVVAMVIDVDGLTELSTRLDPEGLFRRHLRLLKWLRGVVDSYLGVVQRAVDDQVLVLFGVPRNRPDDVARALECALALQRGVGGLRAHGVDVRLAIGVHLGEVTIGLGRRDARYVARGDTTRLARRLSTLADHSEILLSERVLDAAQALFRVRAGPEISLRGGRAPLASYQLEGRRHGLRVAGKGPWLRRGREVDLVRRALQDLAEGRGSILALTGEIGSGKSRLAREIRELAQRRAVPVIHASGRTGGDRRPPLILRDILLDILGLEPDTPASRLSDEAERLPQLGVAERDRVALEGLLGLADSPGEDDTWRAMERVLRLLAHDRATLLVVEDVHHLGPADREALRGLLTRLVEEPVLAIVTATGTLPSAWEGTGTRVELGRFTRPDLARLVRELLEVEEVADEVVDLADRTCEGNPLYVEEMLKFLLHEGRLKVSEGAASLVGNGGSAPLPDTLAGLIAARIDALEPASKGALQLASTIGQSFSLRVLGAAMGLDDATPVVTDLSAHGLVQRVEMEGGDVWAFSSELVREAALRSTLGVQKRTYHRLLADALEALYADDTEAHAEELAMHCGEAGRLVDAARYLHIAGKRLERGHFLERARSLYERGLKWIGEIPDGPDTWDARVQGEAMLSYRSGAVSRLLGEERRAEASLQVALDIASDAGLPWIEIRAHLELGRVYLDRRQLHLAEAHIGQARQLARLEDDPELDLETLEAAAHLADEQGDADRAEQLWQSALRRALDDPGAQARCQLGMANRRLREGDLQGAGVLLERALSAARRSGDRILVGRALNNLGLRYYWAGNYDEALASFRDALAVREGIGYTAGVIINHHNIGDVHFTRGDLGRAAVAFRRSRELAEGTGWRRGVLLNDVYLAYIDGARDGVDAVLPRIEATLHEARALGDAEIAANGAILVARLLREAGRDAEADLRLRAAREEADQQGLRAIVANVDALLGRVER